MGDRLDGKVAVVTGGASGIGEATVRTYVDEGARVVIADLQDDLGAALADDLGDAATYVQVNVASEDDVAGALAVAVDTWGRLDILFNNAGFGGAIGPISSISTDDWDLTMDVLVKGVFLGIKHAAPTMAAQGSGSIINTASICGHQGGYGTHVYTVGKAAVISLTRSAALELAEDGIRVNAICPGYIATPLAAGRPGADAERLQKMRDLNALAQPLPRVGEPQDIANMALFLASDESEWITGQDHIVDGGILSGIPWRRQHPWMKEPHPIRMYRPEGT